MPKKNSLDIPQEKILTEEPQPQQPELTKPKRQISDAQREHLNNIRSKALEKKAEMKEETLKAKLAKTLEKKELVKKYDEHVDKEKEITKPPEKIETPKQRKKKQLYINLLNHLHLLIHLLMMKKKKLYM